MSIQISFDAFRAATSREMDAMKAQLGSGPERLKRTIIAIALLVLMGLAAVIAGALVMPVLFGPSIILAIPLAIIEIGILMSHEFSVVYLKNSKLVDELAACKFSDLVKRYNPHTIINYNLLAKARLAKEEALQITGTYFTMYDAYLKNKVKLEEFLKDNANTLAIDQAKEAFGNNLRAFDHSFFGSHRTSAELKKIVKEGVL